MACNPKTSIFRLLLLGVLVLFLFSACDIFFSDLARKVGNDYYTVIFDPNNDQSAFARMVLQPGYTVEDMPEEPLPAEGTPDPTLFKGWFVVGDDGRPNPDQRFTAMTPVTQDLTVQADWNEIDNPAVTPIVTFDSNGAHRPAVPRQKAPEKANDTLPFLPEEPRREGFVFVGWLVVQCDSSNNVNTNYFLNQYTVIPPGNIVVQAVWERVQPNDAVVTFNSNGATVDASPMNMVVRQGSTLESMPSPPEWNGYVFVGWNRNINGTGASVNTGITINEDITVYAQWRQVESFRRVISFNSMGGNFINPTIVEAGQQTGSLPIPVRRGYTFDRWYDSGSWDFISNQPSGAPWTSDKEVNDNTILFASWVPRTYTVRFFQSDNITEILSPITNVKFDGEVILPGGLGLVPPLPDHVFDGWSTSISGGTIFREDHHAIEQLLFGQNADTQEIRLIARWRYEDPDNLSLSFNSLGGSHIDTRLVVKGTTETAPIPPVRRGFSFTGWWTRDGSLDNNWGSEWTFPRAIEQSTTLFARWTPNNYIFRFHANGGTGTAPPNESIPFNGDITLPGSAGITPPANRVFEGWSLQSSGGTIFRQGSHPVEVLLAGRDISNPSAQITLYAQWVEFGTETVNITFRSENTNIVTMTIIKGQPIPVESRIVPIRTGFTFSGWQVQGTANTWNLNDSVNADLILEAIWTDRTYTVTYHANNSTSTPSVRYPSLPTTGILFGANFTILNINSTNPNLSGFTAPTNQEFQFWTTERDNTNSTRYYPGQSVRNIPGWDDGNIDLYAYWDDIPDPGIVTRMVNFKDGSLTISVAVPHNTAINPDLIPRLERHGYDPDFVSGTTISRWNLEGTETAWDYTVPVTGVVNLTARWVERRYNVVYNAPDASSTVPSQNNVRFINNDNLTIAPAPDRTGWVFQNWNTASDGTGSEFFPGQNLRNLPGWGDENYNHTFTLHAQWAREQYTVVYNLNGGSGTAESFIYTMGTQTNLHSSGLSRTGHSFTGWSTLAGGGGDTYLLTDGLSNRTLNAPSSGNIIVLYAQWNELKYTVTYIDPSDGFAVEISYLRDTDISLGSADLIPVPSGYVFEKWTDSSGGTYAAGQVEKNLAEAGGNIRLTANWVQPAVDGFIISFNSNGGTFVPSASLAAGGTLTFTAQHTPVLAGHTFAGWHQNNGTNGSGWGTLYSSSFTAESTNATLHARWTAQTYTVSYGANSGSGTTESTTHHIGVPSALAANSFTRTGHTFAGWNRAANGSGDAYAAGQIVKDEDLTVTAGGSITLFAQWIEDAANRVTVSFDSNGGSFVAPINISSGGTVEGPLGSPTRTGYTLHTDRPWNTQNGTGDINWGTEFTTSTTVSESTTVFARWIAKTYTVTYNPNNGILGTGAVTTTTHTYDANDALAPSTGYTRAGYLFTGWNTQANGSGTAYAASQSVRNLPGWDDGITLYAQWAENRHTVTFNSLSSIAVASKTVASGSKVEDPFPDPGDFTRTGYDFLGWYLNNGTATGVTWGTPWDFENGEVTSNITLYARWEPIEYTIRLHPNGSLVDGVYDITNIDGTPLVVPDEEEHPEPLEITLRYGEEYQLTYINDAYRRTGYNSTGWNTRPHTGSSATNRPFADGQTLVNVMNTPGVIDLYIQWQVITHLVTFAMNGAQNNIPHQFIQEGETVIRPLDNTIIPPDHPESNINYTFEGWSLDYRLPGVPLDPTTPPRYVFSSPVTEPLTLYAIFGENESPLTIQFRWNENTIPEPERPAAPAAPANQYVYKNGIITQPSVIPDFPGYALVGWYTNDGGSAGDNWGDLWHFTAPVQTSMILYARWEDVTEAPPQWTSTLTAINTGDARFNAMAVHPNTGDIYAVGYITGTTAFNFGNGVSVTGQSSSNPLIVKYNKDGVAQWARTTTASSHAAQFWDVAISIEGTTTYIYAVGEQREKGAFNYGSGSISGPSNYYNPVVVKYDDNSNTVWARTTVNPSGDIGWATSFRGVAVNSSGVYIVGYQEPRGSMNYGNGVIISTTVLDEQPMMVKYDFDGDAQWGYIVTSGGDNGYQDSRFNAIALETVMDGTNERTFIYAVGYQRRNGDDARSTFVYGPGVSIFPAYIDTTRSNVAGHTAVIVKFEEITETTPGSTPNGKLVQAIVGEQLNVGSAQASEFNTVVVHDGNVYAGGMLNHRPVIARFNKTTLTRTGLIQANGTLNPNDNYGVNSTIYRNNMFINYVNSLAVDNDGNIWAAGSLHGRASYSWTSTSGSPVYMEPTGASGNSFVLKINSDFTIAGTTNLAGPDPMPDSVLMRQTRNNANTANISNTESNNRAAFLGIAIYTDEEGNIIVYAAGYQRNIYLYDHGNSKPAAGYGVNTTNSDKPVILRF